MERSSSLDRRWYEGGQIRLEVVCNNVNDWVSIFLPQYCPCSYVLVENDFVSLLVAAPLAVVGVWQCRAGGLNKKAPWSKIPRNSVGCSPVHVCRAVVIRVGLRQEAEHSGFHPLCAPPPSPGEWVGGGCGGGGTEGKAWKANTAN